MSRKKSQRKNKPAPAAGLGVIRVALGVALAVSGFLFWQALQSGGLPGCGPDSGCDKVLNSRWSLFFGLPVSSLAVVIYAFLLGETFRKAIRWPLVTALACLVVGAVVWFVVLQAAVVQAFCAYCMTSHVTGLVGAILLLRRTPVRWTGPAVAVGAAVAVFAIAQAAAPAPAPVQVQVEGRNLPLDAQPQLFSILGGQVQLNLSQVPVSGDRSATNKLVKLFDYTCHHCRDLHHLLHRYSRSNALAIVALPVPLDPSCNPLMTRVNPAHAEACEYARAGLAVFYADPEKFETFSDWLFEPERIQPLAVARDYAASLVGSNEFRAALNDPRIDAQIRTNVTIYRMSSQSARSGRMPQMIFENSVSVGAVADFEQLRQILAANLHRTNAPAR